MARKVKQQTAKHFAERVHLALEGSPLHTILLDTKEEVSKLALAHTETSTAMKFLLTGQERAEGSRAELQRTMNDVREGNAELTARVGNVEKEVSRIGQVVEKHEALYQQHLGKEELKKTVTERLSGAVTKGRAIWLALFGGGGLLATWHFWR